MPAISHIPYPSIHHVLEAEPHERIPPRRPSVITIVDLDPAYFSTATGRNGSSNHRDLMKTIDLRDAEPMAAGDEEQFSFIVHFPDEDPDNEDDARTVFEEKRPSTSRGFLKDFSDTAVKPHNLSTLVVIVARKLMPVKLASSLLRRKIIQH